jgi:hypothetical protein
LVPAPQLDRSDPWAEEPQLAWRWETENNISSSTYRAGADVLLTPFYGEDGVPTRLHLLSGADGEHRWDVSLAGVDGVPADFSVEAVAAGGEALTVLLSTDDGPSGLPQTAALVRLAAEDGSVLEARALGERDDALAVGQTLVLSDGVRRQLQVLDPATWQVRHTVALSPVGDRVSLEPAGPGHAAVLYEGAGWAVVDLGTGQVVAQGEDTTGQLVEVATGGEVVVTAVTYRTGQLTSPATTGCDLAGWSPSGEQLWSRTLGPDWFCTAKTGTPFTIRHVEGLTRTDLMALDPGTGQEAWAAPYPAQFNWLADPWNTFGDVTGPFEAVLVDHYDRRDQEPGDLLVLDAATGAFRHFELGLASGATGFVRTAGGFFPHRSGQVSYHSAAEPGPAWELDGLGFPVIEYVGADLLVVRDGGAYLGYVPAG